VDKRVTVQNRFLASFFNCGFFFTWFTVHTTPPLPSLHQGCAAAACRLLLLPPALLPRFLSLSVVRDAGRQQVEGVGMYLKQQFAAQSVSRRDV
jgi:hypothetical protein